jgi:hypothetical protein
MNTLFMIKVKVLVLIKWSCRSSNHVTYFEHLASSISSNHMMMSFWCLDIPLN